MNQTAIFKNSFKQENATILLKNYNNIPIWSKKNRNKNNKNK